MIAATSNLANCRPENASECLSRANKERNFAHMLEVIYRTERFCARKFKVTFHSKQIVTEKFA